MKVELEKLYSLEINTSLSCMWDGGWVCKVDGNDHHIYKSPWKHVFESHDLTAVECFLKSMVMLYNG